MKYATSQAACSARAADSSVEPDGRSRKRRLAARASDSALRFVLPTELIIKTAAVAEQLLCIAEEWLPTYVLFSCLNVAVRNEDLGD